MPDLFAAFNAWCAFLAPTEGGLSLDPADSGNYTPAGILKGSKFGISAHSYPNLDIANLTIEQADAIRLTDFFDPVRGREVPGPVGFVMAEAAYGSGPETAIRLMQSMVGTGVDGDFGPDTMAALNKALAKPDGIEAFVVEYQAQRLLFEASLGAKWDHNKVGWSRRLFHATAHALYLAGAPIVVA
jgi:lysozyme family protein